MSNSWGRPTIDSVSIALERGNIFGKWLLPLLIVGTGLPIVIGVMRQKRYNNIMVWN